MDDPQPASTGGDDRAGPLIAQARLLRGSGALGRSPALERLFDFLLDCSLEGRSPKELEIADQVFSRGVDAADQDASVRVYVHRLRRKIDDFYAGAGAGETARLAIPKGSYRLVIEPIGKTGEDSAPSDAPIALHRPRPRIAEVVGVLALLVVTALATWHVARRPYDVDAPLQAVRADPLWTAALTNGRRPVIVVGDYYIFGETDASGDVTRLVRQFDVNSAADLARLVAARPEGARYVDLGLDYLPVGIAGALRVTVPIVRRNERELLKPLVVPASQLTPDMVKNANLVYLGYLSGLGSLRDPVFNGSRFTVGDSYDEIVDRRTGRHYMAATHLDANDAQPNQDYALISSFAGPGGNQVIVIAGTRDAALMQAAEFVTRPATLAQITGPLHGATAFEALLAVETLRNVGLRARLVSTSARTHDADWSGRRTQAFPDEAQSDPTVPGAR